MAAWRHSGEPSSTAPRGKAAYTRPKLTHKEEGDTTKLTRARDGRRCGAAAEFRRRRRGSTELVPGIPCARGANVVEGGLDEDLGPEAERRRRFAVAEMLRNGRTTVAQRLCAAELCRRGGVGFEAALELGDRRRGRRGEFKGRSRGSRARLGKGIPGGFAGDLGRTPRPLHGREGRGGRG